MVTIMTLPIKFVNYLNYLFVAHYWVQEWLGQLFGDNEIILVQGIDYQGIFETGVLILWR